jgi:hypothetical protein
MTARFKQVRGKISSTGSLRSPERGGGLGGARRSLREKGPREGA